MKKKPRIPKVIENRIIKRYSKATIFYSFLILAFVSIPIISLFTPFLGVMDLETAPFEFIPMTTLDVAKGLLFQPNPFIEILDHHPEIFASQEIYFFVIFFVLGLAVVLTWFIAILQLIKGLKLLIYGRSSHMYRPIITAFFAILFQAVLIVAVLFAQWAAKKLTVEAGYPIPFGLNTIHFIFIAIEILLLILMNIIYFIFFHRKLYLYDVDLDAYELEILEEDYVPQEISGLDENTKQILNHQYSKSSIDYAHIPVGVPSIGDGAFSNCLKLQSVFIPKSVKKIGHNAFFNCPYLRQIVYNGTKEEWYKVKRGSNWLVRCGTDIIQCTDGNLKVNIYK